MCPARSPQSSYLTTMQLLVYIGLLPGLFLQVSSQAFGERIPLGAIFDDNSEETRTAFTYGIQKHNDEPMQRVKLDANAQKVQTNDSFSVITTICSQMASGMFALFGTHSILTLNTLKSYTRTFHMPYITPSMPVKERGQEYGYELYLRPHYSTAIVDLIRHYGWNKIFYLYNTDEGLMRLQQLFDAISEADINIELRVHRVNDSKSAMTTLAELEAENSEEDKHILLDMPHKDCEELLRLQKNDIRRVKLHYLMIGLGVNELKLDDYKSGGINMTGFQLIDTTDTSTRRFTDDWLRLDKGTWHGAGTPMLTVDVALAVDSVRLVAAALTKMISKEPTVFRNTLKHGKFYNNGSSEGIDCDSEPVTPWKHGHEIMKVLRETEFTGLTGKISFDEFGLRKSYQLTVLEVNLNRGLATIGSWSPTQRLKIHSPSLIREKGNNTVANRTRIITSILTEPYLSLKPHPTDGNPLVGNEKYEGYCADLAKQIAKIVQFDYQIVTVKDAKYGSKNADGSWNGMVGELVRNEADLAIAPLTITSVRERVIDFSKPFMSLGISIMIKKPTKEIPGVFSFMFPLSYEIWMCVIFAYIGVSVVLFLVSRFSPFEWHIEDNTDGPTVTNNFTIFNSLWFSLGAFMQQGCDIEPRSVSGRIVGSVWWFFTLIIISSYTANLAAFLTVERMQSPIETADDLAKQTEIRYGTITGGSTMGFFRGSTIAVYERMWAFMSSAEPSVFVSSNEEGVKRVRESNGRYAFLLESTTNDYINQRKPCDTMKVGSNLDSKGYGIGTPLTSDLRDRVTLAVLELRESGDLQKLEKKWWYDKGECGKEAQNKKKGAASALKLSNVAGIFYILVGGLVLALVVAVIEFLYKSKVEAKRRKTSFSTAVKSKARLSIKGKAEPQTTAVGSPEIARNMSMSTYTYAPAAQLISLDGYADTNTHTQV